MQAKRKIVDGLVIALIAIVLTVYAAAILFFLCWGFCTSLKSTMDFEVFGNVINLPNLDYSKKELKFSNYVLIWKNFSFTKTTQFYAGGVLVKHRTENNFLTIVLNTVLYAGVGSVIQTVVPAMIAYICVKYPGKTSNLINAVVLIVMSMPIIGSAVPTITLLRDLNLYDSFIGNFIQKFNFTGMYFFVFEAFFQTTPDSYGEAAEIDGASQLKVMFEIYMPLAMKMMGTVILILFVNCWNDYQTPLMYLPTKPTLAYAVYYMAYSNNQIGMATLPVKTAGCMFLAIPILIIFMFFKDKIMGNVSLGGVKE